MWEDFFRDPRLRALIRKALEHNRDIRTAMARVEEARAAFAVNEAERSPLVNLTGAGTVSFLPPSLTGGSRPMAERYDLTASMVSYELDFWGRLASMSSAAKARLAASETAARAVRATLIADVANVYFTRLDVEARIGLIKEVIAAREQSSALIETAFERGAVSKLEVLQAEGMLQASRGELAALQAQLITANNYQTFLVGPVGGDLPPGYSLASQRVDASFSPGIPSEVLLKRPDVMAAEQRLIESRANVDAARALFFPRIVLTTNIGLASGTLTSLLSSIAQTGLATFSPSLSMPLLDGGRTQGQLDMAKARENLAVADYERTILSAFREVADLLASQYGLAGQKRAASANWVIQRQRLEAVEARFKAGAASYMEVLDTTREELSAAQQVSQLRRAELSTATMLYKALGGGVPSHGD